MKYSIIVPVYNRPDEVDELLLSLQHQSFTSFEVIIVEDGSSVPCSDVVQKYIGTMDIQYYVKPNSGPGQTRNYGVERCKGEYALILDSDCVLPPCYLQAIEDELSARPADAFGGPDRAHESFTPVQKAINYAMTSFFTTGGIRGGKKKMDKFYPRSFNMGVRTDVYRVLGGFSHMRFGEDIDFSIRIFKGGYSCRLFPEAWVWHKRRTDFWKFFKQIHNSGIARINLYKKYPESLKLVHMLPSIFTAGLALLAILYLLGLVLTCIGAWSMYSYPHSHSYAASMGLVGLGCTLQILALLPLVFFSLLIFIDSSISNKSVKIGLLSVGAAFIQLSGYGSGFLRAWWKRCVMGKDMFSAFEKNFYK